MNKMNAQTFQIINPQELYNPRSNGYSHIAVVPPNMRVIHIAGQGGENKNGEISPFFDQQVQQVFYNIQHAFNRRLSTTFKYCRFACPDY